MALTSTIAVVSSIAGDYPDLILLSVVGGVVSLGVFMLRRVAKAGR